MEPLTAGAIALVTLLLNKTFEKTGEIIVAKAFEQGGKVIELFKHKSRDTADALEAAVKNAALPPGQREDIGEAVLVEKIESVAKADPEIKAAVEALASDTDTASAQNPQLAAAIEALTKAVKAVKAQRTKSSETGKFVIHLKDSNVGVIGDKTDLKGGINFGTKPGI